MADRARGEVIRDWGGRPVDLTASHGVEIWKDFHAPPNGPRAQAPGTLPREASSDSHKDGNMEALPPKQATADMPTWGTRAVLPQRRPHHVVAVEHEGQRYVGGYGTTHDGRNAELWLNAVKPNTLLDSLASGAAIVASLALQHGAPLETIRHSLRRNPDGTAACPLGALIDAISAEVT
jgi:hypothetical protein